MKRSLSHVIIFTAIACLALVSCGGNNSIVPQQGETSSIASTPYHVVLVSLGETDTSYIRFCKEELMQQFPGLLVSIADTVLPADSVPDYAPGKKSAEGILRLLEQVKPSGVNTLLAITEKNIAVNERVLSDGRKFRHWSVLGLGSLVHGVCVCSYHRMPDAADFRKLVVHEFGHTLGLQHCPVKECTMVDGDGSARPVSLSTGLCGSCREKANKRLGL